MDALAIILIVVNFIWGALWWTTRRDIDVLMGFYDRERPDLFRNEINALKRQVREIKEGRKNT